MKRWIFLQISYILFDWGFYRLGLRAFRHTRTKDGYEA